MPPPREQSPLQLPSSSQSSSPRLSPSPFLRPLPQEGTISRPPPRRRYPARFGVEDEDSAGPESVPQFPTPVPRVSDVSLVRSEGSPHPQTVQHGNARALDQGQGVSVNAASFTPSADCEGGSGLYTVTGRPGPGVPAGDDERDAVALGNLDAGGQQQSGGTGCEALETPTQPESQEAGHDVEEVETQWHTRGAANEEWVRGQTWVDASSLWDLCSPRKFPTTGLFLPTRTLSLNVPSAPATPAWPWEAFQNLEEEGSPGSIPAPEDSAPGNGEELLTTGHTWLDNLHNCPEGTERQMGELGFSAAAQQWRQELWSADPKAGQQDVGNEILTPAPSGVEQQGLEQTSQGSLIPASVQGYRGLCFSFVGLELWKLGVTFGLERFLEPSQHSTLGTLSPSPSEFSHGDDSQSAMTGANSESHACEDSLVPRQREAHSKATLPRQIERSSTPPASSRCQLGKMTVGSPVLSPAQSTLTDRLRHTVLSLGSSPRKQGRKETGQASGLSGSTAGTNNGQEYSRQDEGQVGASLTLFSLDQGTSQADVDHPPAGEADSELQGRVLLPGKVPPLGKGTRARLDVRLAQAVQSLCDSSYTRPALQDPVRHKAGMEHVLPKSSLAPPPRKCDSSKTRCMPGLRTALGDTLMPDRLAPQIVGREGRRPRRGSPLRPEPEVQALGVGWGRERDWVLRVPRILPGEGKERAVRNRLMQAIEALESGNRTLYEQVCVELKHVARRHGDALQRCAFYFLKALKLRDSCSSLAQMDRPARESIREMDECRMWVYTGCPFAPFSVIATSATFMPLLLGKPHVHVVNLGEVHTPKWPTLLQLLAQHREVPATSAHGEPVGRGSLKSFRLSQINPGPFARPGRPDIETMKAPGLVASNLQSMSQRLGVEFNYHGMVLSQSSMALLECLRRGEGETLVVSIGYDLKNFSDDPSLEGGLLQKLMQCLVRLRPDTVVVTEGEYDDCDDNSVLGRLQQSFDFHLPLFQCHDKLVEKDDFGRPFLLRFESHYYLPVIISAVACEGSERRMRLRSWRSLHELFSQHGFRTQPVSKELVDAEFEMVKSYPEGFGLFQTQSDLALMWQGTKLARTCAWAL